MSGGAGEATGPRTGAPFEVESANGAAVKTDGDAHKASGDSGEDGGGNNCSTSGASMLAFVKFLATAIGFGVFLLPSFIADIGWGLGVLYLSLVTLLMVGLPQVLEEALAYASDLRAASRNCRFVEYKVSDKVEPMDEEQIFDITGLPYPKDRTAKLPHYVSVLGVTLPGLFRKLQSKRVETYPPSNVHVLVFRSDEDLDAFKENWKRAQRLASDREQASEAELSGEPGGDSELSAPVFLGLGCFDYSKGKPPPAGRRLNVPAVLENRDAILGHQIDFSSAKVVLQDGAPMPLDDDSRGGNDGIGNHHPAMEDALEPLGSGAVLSFRLMNIFLLFFVYILYIPLVNDCGVIEMISKAMRPRGDANLAKLENGSWVIGAGDDEEVVPVESMIVTCRKNDKNASTMTLLDDAGRLILSSDRSKTVTDQCPQSTAEVGEETQIYVEYFGVNPSNFSVFHAGDPDKELVIVSAADATTRQVLSARMHKNLMALVMAAIQAVYFCWLWGKKGAFRKYLPGLARLLPCAGREGSKQGSGKLNGMCDSVGAFVALIGVLLLGYGFLYVAWTTNEDQLPKELRWEGGDNGTVEDNRPGFWWRGNFDLEKVGTLYQFFTLYTVAGILTPVRSEVAQNLSNDPSAAGKALQRAWYVMLAAVFVFYMVVVVKGHSTWGRGVKGNVLDVIKSTHQGNSVVTITAIGAALNLIFSGVLLNASTFKGIRNLVLSQNRRVWNEKWRSCPCGVWVWAVLFTTVMPVVAALVMPKSWISKGSMMMCAIALPFLQGLFCLLAVVANLKALKLQYRTLGSHQRRKWMCPCDKKRKAGEPLPIPSWLPSSIANSQCCKDRSLSCFFFWYMLVLCVVAMMVGLYKAVVSLAEPDAQVDSPLLFKDLAGDAVMTRRLAAVMASIDAEGPGGLLGARLRGSLLGL